MPHRVLVLDRPQRGCLHKSLGGESRLVDIRLLLLRDLSKLLLAESYHCRPCKETPTVYVWLFLRVGALLHIVWSKTVDQAAGGDGEEVDQSDGRVGQDCRVVDPAKETSSRTVVVPRLGVDFFPVRLRRTLRREEW